MQTLYKQTLCFGGSFNPIHHGHLICARTAAEQLGFDRVLLIPSANPPHKAGNQAHELAAAEHRLAMCQLAAKTGLFQVDDLEIKRGGPSYTLLTVQALREKGWSEIHWLIGADMLLDLPNWHQAATLLKETKFVVMARPGHVIRWDAVPEPFRQLQNSVVTVPQIDISATDIRSRIRAGRSIRWLVPEAVEQYIHDSGLYR